MEPARKKCKTFEGPTAIMQAWQEFKEQVSEQAELAERNLLKHKATTFAHRVFRVFVEHQAMLSTPSGLAVIPEAGLEHHLSGNTPIVDKELGDYLIGNTEVFIGELSKLAKNLGYTPIATPLTLSGHEKYVIFIDFQKDLTSVSSFR